MKTTILHLFLFLFFGFTFSQNTILFEEHFNNSLNWKLSDVYYFKTKIDNGFLTINNTSKQEQKIPINTSFDFNKDFMISFKFKGISGNKYKALKFWFNKDDDNKNAQVFALNSNSNWNFESLKNNRWVQATSWYKTNLIHEKDWNTVRIIKLKSRLYFEVNNKLILEKSAGNFNGTKAIFSSFGPQVVAIDDLVFSYITSYTLPQKDVSFILEDELDIFKTENFTNTDTTHTPILKEDYQITYENGKMILNNQTKTSSIISNFNSFASYKDFTISYQAAYVSGNIEKPIYGNIYNKTYKLYFGFSKNNNGFFKILKNQKAQQKGNQNFKTSYLNHHKINTIKLEKVSDELFFSINNKIIKNTKINGCYDLGSKIQLGIDNNLKANFDNLSIHCVFRSIKEQQKRIGLLKKQFIIDTNQDKLALKENSLQMNAQETQFKNRAKILAEEEEELKKKNRLKKDQELTTKFSSKLSVQPYLDKNTTQFKISTGGKHLMILNSELNFITIWNLETMQQVHAYQFTHPKIVSNYSNIIGIEFDWNTTTNLPSIIGHIKNSSQKNYFWYNGNTLQYGAETGIKAIYGFIEHVYGNEALTTVRNFSKKKDGSYDKPIYLKLQFYNFKTKKWRIITFDKAKNVKISNAYKRAFIYYEDKMEVYSFSDKFNNYKLIKTFTTPRYNRFKIDSSDPKIMHLKYSRKNSIKAWAAYNMSSDKIIKEDLDKTQSKKIALNNVYEKIPKITFEASKNNSLKKVKLTHNDKSVNVTADNDEFSALRIRTLKEVTKNIKIAEQNKNKQKEAKKAAQLVNLMGKLKQFGNSYKFNYKGYNYLQIGNEPYIKASNMGGDLRAIGKFCDNTSGHFGKTLVLAVQTRKQSVGEQLIFKLLSFDDYGVTSKTLGVTQKVRGKVTQLANLSLLKTSDGYTINTYVEGRKKTFKVKSKCR